MSNKELIKQLESLREHCNEMIDKEDPEDTWRADTEALNEAIKAIAGLDIDQNKNGGINRMSEKTKVTIEHPDGHRKEVSADTVLCFTVDKGAELMAGKARIIEAQELFIGRDIPEPIFAETIGSLLASFVWKAAAGQPHDGILQPLRHKQDLRSKEQGPGSRHDAGAERKRVTRGC